MFVSINGKHVLTALKFVMGEIDSHNAQNIWKNIQNSVNHTPSNHHGEIGEVSHTVVTIRRNFSERNILQNWARPLIWIFIIYIKSYRHMITKRTI